MQNQPRRQPLASRSARNSANVTSAIGMGETAGRLRARRNSLLTQTIIGLTMLVCIALLLGSLAQAWSNSQLAQQVVSAQQQLQQLQSQHDSLAQQAAHYQDPAIIEREAREQLGYVRPGEHEIIIISPTEQPQPAKQARASNSSEQNFWQAWWNALFGD